MYVCVCVCVCAVFHDFELLRCFVQIYLRFCVNVCDDRPKLYLRFEMIKVLCYVIVSSSCFFPHFSPVCLFVVAAVFFCFIFHIVLLPDVIYQTAAFTNCPKKSDL